MELKYTKNGKYKVMISFKDGPTFIYNRFDTLEEAEYEIDFYYNHGSLIDSIINEKADLYLEVD